MESKAAFIKGDSKMQISTISLQHSLGNQNLRSLTNMVWKDRKLGKEAKFEYDM